MTIKKILLIAFLASGCSQAHVDIATVPETVTKQQAQLDDLQCASYAKYRGPWLFQLFFYYSDKADYRKCLESKGYTVKD